MSAAAWWRRSRSIEAVFKNTTRAAVEGRNGAIGVFFCGTHLDGVVDSGAEEHSRATHDVDGIHSLRNTGTHDTLHGELRPIREYTEKGERGSNEGKEAAPRQRKCFFFTLI